MKNRLFATALLLLVPVLALASDKLQFSPSPHRPQPIPDSVHAPIVAGDIEATLKALDTIKDTKAKKDGTWQYLTALTMARAERQAEAIDLLQEIETTHPEGPWHSKARFLRVDLLGDLGRHAEAQALLDEEAIHLRSFDRRAELANVCFAVADGLLASVESALQTSSMHRIVSEVQSILAEILALDVSPVMQLRVHAYTARLMEQIENRNEAINAHARWMDVAKGILKLESDSALEVKLLEIRYRACELGVLDNARRAVLPIEILEFDLTSDKAAALLGERLYTMQGDVQILLGTAKAAAVAYGDDQGHAKAVAVLRVFLQEHPDHTGATQAAYDIGAYLDASQQSEDAVAAYREFLARPKLPKDAAIEFHELAAKLQMAATWRVGELLMGMAQFPEASIEFKTYVARFPTGSKWSAAQRSIVDMQYRIGEAQATDGEFEKARLSWTQFMDENPLSPLNVEASVRIADAYLQEAVEVDKETKSDASVALLHAALNAFEIVVKKNPRQNHASNSLYQMGQIYEDMLGDLPMAIATFQRCNFGSRQWDAGLRLTDMLEESLSIRTLRTIRSNETPTIQVTTRNLDELTVELYALDLEAYFRRHQTHRSIEDLDLDLIQADTSFPHKPERGTPHERLIEDLVLPIDAPGVWVVTVVSGKHRATTLVMVSDIDLIIESNASEAVIFAQDMVQNEPAPGTRLVLLLAPDPDGSETVVLEAETGKDGLAYVNFPYESASLAVLGISGAHRASEGLQLGDFGLKSATSSTSFMYTERSTYLPGETVFWRGAFRVRDGNGNYVFQAGREYEVSVLDSAGRQLSTNTQKLSAFGTLHGEVALASEAKTGQYTIRISDPKTPAFAKTLGFKVSQYEVPTARIVATPQRAGVLRGEPVLVDLVATYAHGAPIPQAAVSIYRKVRGEDDHRSELVTDSEGRATVRVDGSDLLHADQVYFTFSLPQERVSCELVTYISSQAFSAALTTDSELIFEGETFAVALKTIGVDGKATARDMNLRVLHHKVDERGVVHEVLAAEYPISTNSLDQSGIGQVAVRLQEGGSYTLRVEGMDENQNPVSDSTVIFVSGEEDNVRLRFFPERIQYEVGEIASLRFHNRTDARLALVMIEGGGIVDYSVQRIEAGDNNVSFGVNSSHFSRVYASVSLMAGHKFHRAVQHINVGRKLQVEVSSSSERVLPGEPVEITVTTKDGLGNPVPAEFSIALVDDVYFDLYPDRTGHIAAPFLNTKRREKRLSAATTCEFVYEGVTDTISAAILAEVERLAKKSAFERRRSDAQVFLGKLSDKSDINSDSPFDSDDSPSVFGLAPGSPVAPAAGGANDVIGLGGGAGGKFGGRLGGRRNLRASAGLSQNSGAQLALESATRYWNPNAVTGKDGTLTLTIPMPQKGGTWRVLSRGVGHGTRLGQGLLRIQTHAPFLVELLAPSGVRSGDTFEARARIHYTGEEAGTAYLSLNVGGVVATEVRERALTLNGTGSATVSLGDFVAGDDTGMLRLDLDATFDSDEHGRLQATSASKSIAVRPFGVILHATDGGHLAARTDLDLKLPGSGPHSDVALEVYVGGGLGSELIGAALNRASFGHLRSSGGSNHANTAGELLGVLSVMEWLREVNPSSGDLAVLAARSRGLVDSLAASQGQSGAWDWTTKQAGRLVASYQPPQMAFAPSESGSLETTVLALLALEKASHSVPIPEDVLAAGVASLEAMFKSLPASALEQKAMALHGLSVLGMANFADVNRLYRSRSGLSPAALSHLVLTLVELNRKEMAAELAQSLSALAIPTSTPTPRCGWPTSVAGVQNTSWSRDPHYGNGLALWAIARSLPDSPQLALGAEGLLASAPWGAGRTKGMALAALTAYGSDALVSQGAFEVDITVGNEAPVRLHVARDVPGASLVLDMPDMAASSEQIVRLELVGDARTGRAGFAPTYHVLLSGMSPEKAAYSTPRMPEPRMVYRIMPPTLDGRTLDTGFDTVGANRSLPQVEQWINTVENLPSGERCMVEVSLQRDTAATRGGSSEALPNFLEIDIPLPAGATVVPGTLTGTFATYRKTRGGLNLTLQAGDVNHYVYFQLIGTAKGFFQLPPPVVRATTDPGRIAMGTASELSVLTFGEASPDKRRPTPDELYSRGRFLFNAGDLEGAHTHLTHFYQEYEPWFESSTRGTVAKMLLTLAIGKGDSEGTVLYFEALKEGTHSTLLTLKEVLAIGRAYRDMGEHERATTMFMATIAETFNRDLRVAGVLETYGPFLAKSNMLDRLWREYPDLPAVVATRLSHADALLAKAKIAHRDPNLRSNGLDQVALTLDSIMVLREFMALYPEHVLCASAGQNLVSAYLELEDYKHVAELAGRLAERFTDPVIRDDFRYTRAVASWYEGRPAEAVDLLQGIADANYVDERGAESKSVNHNLALYLLGQIYHAAGDLDLASDFYGRVSGHFADANELHYELEETRLELDEVTEVRPGGIVQLPLRFKGLSEVELLLYPVDLMTLYLREGDLESVAKVNLAGIAPVAKESYKLSPRKGLEVGFAELQLPSLETGAYLAMARSQGLFTSGLVLVTDLELLVREDSLQGQVRAQVTRIGVEGYLADVDIRVVGSGDGKFQTGKTDRRGLFATSGLSGTATVIARLGDREYAFHRGVESLGDWKKPSQSKGASKDGDFKATTEAFFGNVLGQNRQDQGSRIKELQSNMKRKSLGVEVQSLP